MKILYVVRHVLAILVFPVTVTILVPTWIVSGQAISPTRPSSLVGWAVAGVGVVLLVGGAALAAGSVGLFFTEGRGTLAPWDPPRRLVIRGVYGHVRNPMISGVTFVLLGEATTLRSVPLLEWAAGFALVSVVYIPLMEEPMLRARFGAAYEAYARNVPRLIPRRRAWKAEDEQAGEWPGDDVGGRRR